MDIDETELGVLQLSDSFFPTGIFATSNGLEFLFAEKKIHTMDDVTKIIRTNIVSQMGPSDCVIVSETFDGIVNQDFEKIIDADNVAFATKTVREIREASVRSGIQLLRCVTEFQDDKILNKYQNAIKQNTAHGIFSVAFAICCNTLGIKKEKCMMMLLYGFTTGIVGAALRLGLIQHFEGQKIIHAIKPVITDTIKENSKKSLEEIWQFSPQMDITQMSHEKMDSKMFIT